jgi:hypothetical protein
MAKRKQQPATAPEPEPVPRYAVMRFRWLAISKRTKLLVQDGYTWARDRDQAFHQAMVALGSLTSSVELDLRIEEATPTLP